MLQTPPDGDLVDSHEASRSTSSNGCYAGDRSGSQVRKSAEAQRLKCVSIGPLAHELEQLTRGRRLEKVDLGSKQWADPRTMQTQALNHCSETEELRGLLIATWVVL